MKRTPLVAMGLGLATAISPALAQISQQTLNAISAPDKVETHRRAVLELQRADAALDLARRRNGVQGLLRDLGVNVRALGCLYPVSK